MSNAQLQIAVVGAGIGGLAAASLLADRGFDVTVFDQFDAPRPVGSGLVIQPVGRDVLDAIGVGDAARAMGNNIHRMFGDEADHGRPVLNVHYTGRKGLAIHRAALFQALLGGVQTRNIPLITSAEITGFSDGFLQSRDAQYGPFDLVVDAAGAGSPLSPLQSRPLPYGAIWGTVDWPDTILPKDQLSQKYRRADRMIGALPIGKMPQNTEHGDGRFKAAIFWSMPRDAYGDWQQAGLTAWKDEARALWPDFAPFLDQITDADQMLMARYTHGTLRRPFGDGIVHIGDAAHRASPQLGQGANMALLDAHALALALVKACETAGRSADIVSQALPIYARARRWHVRIYQTMSAAFTPQYQSDSRLLPKFRDRILFPVSMIPPTPRILTSLVAGTMLPPLASLTPPSKD
ncbi:FAD-dependent oxidoreductase [Aestuariibius sp. HNIBRBA575]|uniref:FAD-dependent oxidoreductase n=1 Tax=Aestuariibius sp. HNIBRBA575 TaxID=3233343 RepID=UPI0034A2A301